MHYRMETINTRSIQLPPNRWQIKEQSQIEL